MGFLNFSSTNFQRAAGGYGGIIVNNRDVTVVPFGTSNGDITLAIGDWFVRSHKVIRIRKKLSDSLSELVAGNRFWILVLVGTGVGLTICLTRRTLMF
ncbi:monocopper oxidase-like protein SKU5 isoform X1 [Rutidosis leptorrhynchoides]|uniref:monocopper oxidase-like protein SKU5 isoform X1 n=1 Tax=Rutidosis leptorrhynchoides TaxID=125765 RepID=UPI003A9A1A76